MNKSSMDAGDLTQATDMEDSLANIKSSAPTNVQPYIEANRQAAQDIIDLFSAGGGSGTRDLQDFRAAGLELINRCAAFIEG